MQTTLPTKQNNASIVANMFKLLPDRHLHNSRVILPSMFIVSVVVTLNDDYSLFLCCLEGQLINTSYVPVIILVICRFPADVQNLSCIRDIRPTMFSNILPIHTITS